MELPVHTSFISNSANRSGKTRTETRHLVVHETVTIASARKQLAYFNGGDREANAHGFIDWSEILLTLPFTEVGWHVGPNANGFTEGYELCHAASEADFAKEWSLATEWFACRCQAYGRGADMILSHHEIALRYGGTDHTDPDEYFAKYGKTIHDFRTDVAKRLAASPESRLDPEAVNLILQASGSLYQLAADDARIALNYASNALRKAAQLPVTTVLGTPSRSAAEQVIAVYGALWPCGRDEAVQDALHVAADALRDAAGFPKN